MSFAAPLDPTSRGLVITSADWLREAHNALSPPSAISLDGLGLERGTEDVSLAFVLCFYFVAFCSGGRLTWVVMRFVFVSLFFRVLHPYLINITD
jgi:hypothetical protein